jgi:hypothetical protein
MGTNILSTKQITTTKKEQNELASAKKITMAKKEQ